MTKQTTFFFLEDEVDSPSGRDSLSGTVERSDSFKENDAEADRGEVLRRLRAAVGRTGSRAANDAQRFSTGCPPLDALLPHGGLRHGTLTEWVAENDACGAATLALAIVAQRWNSNQRSGPRKPSSRTGGTRGPVVVVDPEGTFYPPAAVSLGIPAEQIICCRPCSRVDSIWSIDQALRCPAVSAVWAPLGAWLDDRDARRLQLAAEQGKTLGCLIRPAAVRGKPSFAETRFHVAVSRQKAASRQGGYPWSMDVTIERSRGGSVGACVRLAIDETGGLQHEAAVMYLASQLADPASAPAVALIPRTTSPARDRHRRA